MKITTEMVYALKTLMSDAYEILEGCDDPEAMAEVLTSVKALHAVLEAEVKRNGGPVDCVGSYTSEDEYDVLLVPYGFCDIDKLKEYAESVAETSWTTQDLDDCG